MKLLFILALSFTFLGTIYSDEITIERRAAIDVGSGSTKVTIAEVDTTNNKISSVLFEESFPVPYQAALESSYDGTFDEKIRETGIKTFRQIKDIAEDLQVQKISAVATAAFRNANNGENFAEEVEKEIGISLKIISQREEGTLAFFSGVASCDNDPKNLVVWDIGTGSYQLTTMLESGELAVFMGNVGSVPFKNYIIDLIQEKNSDEVNTPNPMSEEDMKDADSYARSLARKASKVFKDKIKNPETTLIGIGRLFSHSIGPICGQTVAQREPLRNYIKSAVGLSDEELNNPFANVDVSNAIFVLGFMKGLQLHEIHIVDTKSTRGMLIYTPYWQAQQ